MTFTGSPNNETPSESQTQTNATPLSQRGSGQSVLFTPLQAAQAAAAQISQQRLQAESQQQQQVDAGSGSGSGNDGNAGDGNTCTAAITNNMSFADFMRVMSQQVHAHDFRRDGEKVNIRGGIDRVLRDQVPKDLADRANWIRAAQTALSINGFREGHARRHTPHGAGIRGWVA